MEAIQADNYANYTVVLRNLKSDKLKPEEISILKEFTESQPTKGIAATLIGIKRESLDRVLWKGSCSPSVADLIRAHLKMIAKTA